MNDDYHMDTSSPPDVVAIRNNIMVFCNRLQGFEANFHCDISERENVRV